MARGEIYVVNRHGEREALDYAKIERRIASLAGEDLPGVVVTELTKTVISHLHPGVATSELDEIAAAAAAARILEDPDYGLLAGRIAVDNLRKQLGNRPFSATVEAMAELYEPGVLAFVRAHAAELDAAVEPARDLAVEYSTYRVLERSYLARVDGRVQETPQHALMRVACGIHSEDGLDAVVALYRGLAARRYIFGSPTLFHAGLRNGQLASCFLLSMDDSATGIMAAATDAALISKSAGGVGMSLSSLRGKGSAIRSTGGTSNGLVPPMRILDAVCTTFDQGGGKRRGAFAVYAEPWHADVYEFLDARKPNGNHEERARNLFTALWVPDLFYKRVTEDAHWTLFSPSDAPDLVDLYGDAFERRYEALEAGGGGRRVRARDLFRAICGTMLETGMPFILHKDAVNGKNNQANLGTIRNSNLCTEIVQYARPDEIAVCNLGSVGLPAFVSPDGASFDFAGLADATGTLVRALNRVIDVNRYPVESARRSNAAHRPIGIGIQGLANVFAAMGMEYGDARSRALNRRIAATMYHAALDASCELARLRGPYASYAGSPASRGLFQHDLWDVRDPEYEGLDWGGLRARVAAHGLRNSLLIAHMPTASTSLIMGNAESFEPFESLVQVRKTLSAEHTLVVRELVRELKARGLWGPAIVDGIIRGSGSVQGIEAVPEELRRRFKTVWEIDPKVLIEMQADRAPFIDQASSANVYMPANSPFLLGRILVTAWKAGLKNGAYYTKIRSATQAAVVLASCVACSA